MKSKTALTISFIMLAFAAPAWANGAPDEGDRTQEVMTPVSGAGAEAVDGGLDRAQRARMGAVTTSPMPPAIRKVSVLIESSPTNSDIEIDGVYVGATPVQLWLKEGVHHVKISREGFLPWARAVKAYNGLYVSPTLVKESTRKADVTESASAQ